MLYANRSGKMQGMTIITPGLLIRHLGGPLALRVKDSSKLTGPQGNIFVTRDIFLLLK